MPEVDKIIDFEIPKLSPSIIMVTGVGGGGSNAAAAFLPPQEGGGPCVIQKKECLNIFPARLSHP